MPESSTTAIVGVGNIGSALARQLNRGGESIVLAANDRSHAEARRRTRTTCTSGFGRRGDRGCRCDRFRAAAGRNEGSDPAPGAPAGGKGRRGPLESDRIRRLGQPDADTPRRTVLRLDRRPPAPTHCALRKGVWYDRRGRSGGSGSATTTPGRTFLRHRRRRGHNDDRASDPRCRFRAFEGWRPRRRQPNRGARRRPFTRSASTPSLSISTKHARRPRGRNTTRMKATSSGVQWDPATAGWSEQVVRTCPLERTKRSLPCQLSPSTTLRPWSGSADQASPRRHALLQPS